MKTLLGLFLIALGIFLAVYVGVWLMFIGGIVGIIEACKMTPVHSIGIAIGILKIMLASFVGWVFSNTSYSFWSCIT